MNDVEFGGATVFPCLNVSVPAKKGTALIWYNLKLSGAYETRSLHGGCPVLKGFKWSELSGYILKNVVSSIF